ncbi:MAG: carboxymuconolactone decarboxylase family protein, partial [Roseobacter sp.]
TTISKGAGVPQDVIDALRNDTAIEDPKLEALRQFSIVVNQTQGWPSDADVEAFLAAGYSKQTILEVVLGAAFKVMSNYTNHIAATEVDSAFAANAWTDARSSAA